MVDLKRETRERMELRGYIRETLNTILETVRATKPSEYVPVGGKETSVGPERAQGMWTDWLDQSGPIITKGLKLADLLADDAVGLLESVIAERKGTSESKPSSAGGQ